MLSINPYLGNTFVKCLQCQAICSQCQMGDHRTLEASGKTESKASVRLRQVGSTVQTQRRQGPDTRHVWHEAQIMRQVLGPPLQQFT